ncbi:MAG: 50S ribosomal protein L28, partial [Lachnospiraceae bacterium]|nr:50S ribosomal protein L28 [Lachnospiraceae bacterium]
RRSNHMWKANIRKVRVKMPNGSVKTMHVSARALRSGLVERA